MEIVHIIVFAIVTAMLVSPLAAVIGGAWWFTGGHRRFPLSRWSGFIIACSILAVASVLGQLLADLPLESVGRFCMAGVAVGLFGLATQRVLPLPDERRSVLTAIGLVMVGVLVLVVGASLNSYVGASFSVSERAPGQWCLKDGERGDAKFVLQALALMALAFALDMRFRKRGRTAAAGLIVLLVLLAGAATVHHFERCSYRDVSRVTA